MPTYDYQCDACGHAFEEWQSFHDAELNKCPQCKKKKLRRLLGGGAAIIFKGAGFYETDYRSDSYLAAAKAESEPKAEAKAEAKTDATPETKGDSKTVKPAAEAKPAKAESPKPETAKPKTSGKAKSRAGDHRGGV
jgi:putative FmdB family regulatory protein